MADKQPQPEQPPQLNRRVDAYWTQRIGIPALALIPLLAAFGVFGETRAKSTAESLGVVVTVEYPSAFRYKMTDPLDIVATNRSDRELRLSLRIDGDYLDQFSNVMLTPQPSKTSDEYVEFDLGELRPGESIKISGEIQGETYGLHRGAVRSEVDGREGPAVAITTLSYP